MRQPREINKRSYVVLTIAAILSAITTGLSIAAAPFAFSNPLFEAPAFIAFSSITVGSIVFAVTLFSVLKRQNSFKGGFAYAAALLAIAADVATGNYLWGALGPYSIAIITAVALAGIAGIIYSGGKIGRPPVVSVSETLTQTTEPTTNNWNNEVEVSSERSEVEDRKISTAEPAPDSSSTTTNSTTVLDAISSMTPPSVTGSNSSVTELSPPPPPPPSPQPSVETILREESVVSVSSTDSSDSDDDLDVVPARMPGSRPQDAKLERPLVSGIATRTTSGSLVAVTIHKKENEKTNLLASTTKEEPKTKLLSTKHTVGIPKLIHDIEQAGAELHKANQAYRELLAKKPKNGLFDIIMDQVLGDAASGDFSRANYDKWEAAMNQVKSRAKKLGESIEEATKALPDLEKTSTNMEKLRTAVQGAKEQVEIMTINTHRPLHKKGGLPFDIGTEQRLISNIQQAVRAKYQNFIEAYQNIPEKQSMPSATRSKLYGSLDDEYTPEDNKQNTPTLSNSPQSTHFEPIPQQSSFRDLVRLFNNHGSLSLSVSPERVVMEELPQNQATQENKTFARTTLVSGYGLVDESLEKVEKVDTSFFRNNS